MTSSFKSSDTFNGFDAFVFDLDGTLLDTLPDLVSLTNKVLVENGFPERSVDEIRSYVGNGARALMYQAVPPGADEQVIEDSYHLWRQMYSRYGINLTEPYTGIPEVLRSLQEQGKKLAVLSNKFDEGTKETIGRYFPGVFPVVYGINERIPRKPDPAGLLRVVRELGCEVDRTVYLGDSFSDIVTARAAGCFGLGVTWGYHTRKDLEKAGAQNLIDQPEQILQYVQ